MANLSLGATLESYIDDQVKSGIYNNKSEVVRDALRRQMLHDTKLAALRGDINAGIKSIEKGDYGHETADSIMKEAVKEIAEEK